jgi:hypothetical protein
MHVQFKIKPTLHALALHQTGISLTHIIGKAEVTVCKVTGGIGHDKSPFGSFFVSHRIALYSGKLNCEI